MLVSSWIRYMLPLVAGTICVTFAGSTRAQVETTTTTTKGQATKTATVERGTVVLVQGNDLIIKMDDGMIRHFPNVPESAKVYVDGKALGIHDLKPGMKLQRTITTTTTPETVKTVQTVTGTVWNVMPPNSVTLTLEDGKNQTFKIPNNQKFNINGQMTDAWGLRNGMKITATKIIETPETVVSQQSHITGTIPPAVAAPAPAKQVAVATPPPPAPAPDVPILVAMVEVTPVALPKTGSELPLLGLFGLLTLGASLGIKLLRVSCGQ